MRGRLVARGILGCLVVALAATSAPAQPPAERDKKPQPLHPALRRAEDIKPLLLTPIPDDPPPHEGALFDLPYVIEPPDLLLVEVLEALPGRPISGERLVRPDGTINIGFYGDLHVRGLTPTQVKEKLILHLRRYIPDEVLGLVVPEDPEGQGVEREPQGELPALPREEPPALEKKSSNRSSDVRRPGPGSHATKLPRRLIHRVAENLELRRGPRAIARAQEAEKKTVAGSSEKAVEMPGDEGVRGNEVMLPAGQGVKITIEIQNTLPPGFKGLNQVPEPAPAPESTEDIPMVRVEPKHSDRVFVDVTAYNSKTYYVQGDVAAPGRMPVTGNETVLDALNHAGGLIQSADPKEIVLVRPARAGKPARVYRIDHDAILTKGDPRANLQVFPGDRLVIGRQAIISQTIRLDRLSAPLQTIFHSTLQQSYMLGSLKYLGNPAAATPTISAEQREAVLKALSEFWSRALSQPQGAALDEKTLREVLLRAMTPPTTTEPKPKD